MSGNSDLEKAIDGFVADLVKKGIGPGGLGLPEIDDMDSISSVPVGTGIGRYVVLGSLGIGGQGEVLLVSRDGERYALKRSRFRASPRARLRLAREADILGRIKHPNACGFVEAEFEDTFAYVVMPYLAGRPLLRAILERSGPGTTPWRFENGKVVRGAGDLLDDLSRLLTAFADVADGLDAFNEQGIVHRDVKPGNIMVVDDGAATRLVVFDFGYAQEDDGRDVTTSNDAPGTPAYMAPEQLNPERGVVDRRTDVYGLAVTLYETLALQRAFKVTNPQRLVATILDGTAPKLRAVSPVFSRELEAVVAKAMDPRPARRFATAGRFADELRRLAGAKPTLTRPPNLWQSLLDDVERRPRRYAVLFLAGIAVALLAATLFLWWRHDVERERRRVVEEAAALGDLMRELDELYPIEPKEAARFERWLERARSLRAVMATAAASSLDAPVDAETSARAELRFREDPRDRIERERVTAMLERVRQRPPAGRDRDLERELLERQEALEARRNDAPILSIGDALARLDRAVPVVEARLVRARAIERASIVDAADRWRRAAAAVASHPRFAGLRLEPRVGLLPLGTDPHSGLEEFLHLPTHAPGAAIPERDAGGRFKIDADSGVILVLVPGGKFLEGAHRVRVTWAGYDAFADPNEQPLQAVDLAPFLIGKYETTQGQWLRMSQTNPSAVAPRSDAVGARNDLRTHPVESVTYFDVDRTLWKFGLELPTEAQWEYAARGHTVGGWWCGEARALLGALNVADESARERDPSISLDPHRLFDDGYALHAPVDALRPNPYGLYHVLGNVAEWCRDRVTPYGLAAARPGDGYRHAPHENTFVLRGGAFDQDLAFARVTARYGMPPDSASWGVGVRVAVNLR